ncbi:MAG: DUF5522 domain-containing protein, partial [Myxococcota bacterium]
QLSPSSISQRLMNFSEKGSGQKAHEVACAEGKTHYLDPETGYSVFTEIGLKQRGKCCGCGCRHCPWRSRRAISLSSDRRTR